MEKLADVLSGEHFEVFYEDLEPIGDDLGVYIEKYSKIKFGEEKEKHNRNILKMVDNLKRRQRAYKLHLDNPQAGL